MKIKTKDGRALDLAETRRQLAYYRTAPHSQASYSAVLAEWALAYGDGLLDALEAVLGVPTRHGVPSGSTAFAVVEQAKTAAYNDALDDVSIAAGVIEEEGR